MEKTNLEIENDKNAIALFKYGIIAPLINDIHSFKSKEEFFRDAASKQYTLPNGQITVVTSGTIKKWYIDYCKYGFDILKPKSRNDAGLSRKIPLECIEKIYSLIEQFPHITGKAVYKKLIEDGSINAKDVSLASLYRFINNHKLYTSKNTIEKKPFEMEFANDMWQRGHISWSNYFY